MLAQRDCAATAAAASENWPQKAQGAQREFWIGNNHEKHETHEIKVRKFPIFRVVRVFRGWFPYHSELSIMALCRSICGLTFRFDFRSALDDVILSRSCRFL
jgi:hypothetical protein